MPFHCPRPERLITSKEAAVLRWLVVHAPVGDVTAFLARPLEAMRIVGGCDCGCSSLDFVPDARSETIVADALAVYPDNKMAGLILWGRAGEIQWLEVYEMHPVADRFPEAAYLRTFEQQALERAKP